MGVVLGAGIKCIWLYGLGTERTVRIKSGFIFLNRHCVFERPKNVESGVSLNCKELKNKGESWLRILVWK